MSMVMAGGGFRHGQVIGSTEADGGSIRERPVTPAISPRRSTITSEFPDGNLSRSPGASALHRRGRQRHPGTDLEPHEDRSAPPSSPLPAEGVPDVVPHVPLRVLSLCILEQWQILSSARGRPRFIRKDRPTSETQSGRDRPPTMRSAIFTSVSGGGRNMWSTNDAFTSCGSRSVGTSRRRTSPFRKPGAIPTRKACPSLRQGPKSGRGLRRRRTSWGWTHLAAVPGNRQRPHRKSSPTSGAPSVCVWSDEGTTCRCSRRNPVARFTPREVHFDSTSRSPSRSDRRLRSQ